MRATTTTSVRYILRTHILEPPKVGASTYVRSVRQARRLQFSSTSRLEEHHDYSRQQQHRQASSQDTVVSSASSVLEPQCHRRFDKRKDEPCHHDDVDPIAATTTDLRRRKSSSQHHSYLNHFASIYDMDAFRIKGIQSIDSLEQMVRQIESPEYFVSNSDMQSLIIPLARVANKFDTLHGAQLCERLLLACLSQQQQADQSSLSSSSQDLHHSSNSSSSPSPSLVVVPTALYNLSIMAWGNLKSPQGAERAQAIFDLLLMEYHRNKPGAKPDRRTYKSLLRAYAVSGTPHGPAKAFELLQEMERLSGIADLLEKSQRRGSASNATATGDVLSLQRTERKTIYNAKRQNRHNIPIPPPDRVVYNAVLSAYSKSFVVHHPHALHRILHIVNRMNRLFQLTQSPEYQLDQFSYLAVLRAYSRFIGSTHGPAPLSESSISPHRIERFVQQMIECGVTSDTISLSWACGVAIEAWIKAKPVESSLSRAHDLVLAMAGRKTLDGFHFPPHVYPEQESIWKLLRAWENGNTNGARPMIDELVNIAVDAPFDRIYTLNQAAEFWSRSGWEYAPDLIEKMLERSWERSTTHRHLKPTGQTFAIAMRAWLRNRRDEAPHRAELLLHQMLLLFEETNDRYYRPRDEHLRFVLTCWLNRCSDGKRYQGVAGYMYPAEHVEAHVQWMPGYDWVKNPSGHFSMAIRAWAAQVLPEEDEVHINVVQRAGQLLNRLHDAVGSLPAFPCNWCLEACARPQSTVQKRKEAYDAAIDTFRRGERNARTFVLMIQVFKSHVDVLDDDHLAIIEELFQECCSCGMLTQDLIWHVVHVVSPESLQKLFGVSYQYASFIVKERQVQLDAERMRWNGVPPSGLMVTNLPQEWSRKANTQRQLKS